MYAHALTRGCAAVAGLALVLALAGGPTGAGALHQAAALPPITNPHLQHLLFYTCCTPEVDNQCDECFVPAEQGPWCDTGFTNDTQVAIEGVAHGMRALLAVHDVFFFNGHGGDAGGLLPDWETRWAQKQALLEPLFKNGTMLGVFIGDELITGKRISVADITTAVNAVRAFLDRIGHSDAVVFQNESPGTFSAGFKVPANLTHIGIDDYGLTPNQTRAWYAEHIYPAFTTPQQRAMIVPGAFGSRLNPDRSLAEYEVYMSGLARDYFAWAAEDERVAGMAPWHWDSRSPKVVSQYKEVGTRDMPQLRAQWIAIGNAIRANRRV